MENLLNEIVKLKNEYLNSTDNFKKVTERYVRTQIKIKNTSVSKDSQEKDIEKSVNSSLQIIWTRIEHLDHGYDFLHELRKKSFDVFLLNFFNSNKSNEQKLKAIGIFLENYDLAIYSIIKEYLDEKKLYDRFHQEIETMKQEIKMLLYRKISKYNPYEGAFYTWMRTIAINCIKSWMKGKSKVPSTFSEEDYEDIYVENLTPVNAFERYSETIDLYRPILELNDYPWKIITYILSKNEIPAKEIVGCYGALTLSSILDIIVYDIKCFNIDGEKEENEIVFTLEKFRNKFKLKVSDVISPQDYTARKRLSEIFDEEIGNTRLNDYFTKDQTGKMKDPMGSIHDWTGRVGKKLRDKIIDELD